MTFNLTILSGEMSGDLVGGALAVEIRRRRPDVQLWGIGSKHEEAAGVELLYNSADWGSIGIVEALKVYPRLRFEAYPRVIREIAVRKPNAVILIDFGAFNVKVARWCAANRVPVLWYFPPGSWRRSGKLYSEMARITDRVATPFPWSAERLRSVGVNVEFVGHPLLEIVKPTLTRAQFADRFGMEAGHPIIGLLPGSRAFEVEYNTPAMLGAAQLIRKDLPDAQFVFGAASPAARARIAIILASRKKALAEFNQWAEHGGPGGSLSRAVRTLESKLGLAPTAQMVTPEGFVVSADLKDREARHRVTERVREQYDVPPVVLTEGLTYDVMAHSDAMIVCSGTATLEAAILGTPMAILYRGSKLMQAERVLLNIRPEHIGMPNIIANRRIMPEFIQDEANPPALAEAIIRVLRDPTARAQAKSDLAEVRAVLGEPGASARTAEIAIELAGLARSGEKA